MLMPDDRTILIAGEQAEVFDNQMDVDRALIEAGDDCIAFRPEIDGEWNEMIMLGQQPPRLWMCDSNTRTTLPGPYNWTCVVDIAQAVWGFTEPSGFRMRLQCVEPNTEAKRQGIRSAAIQHVKTAMELVKKSGGKASNTPKGFGK